MTPFYKMRKSYMTLLETMIAMTILSVVLVFAFGFFRELTVLTRMTDEVQKESFKMRYLESRLSYIFERIVNEKSSSKRDFFFYTQPERQGHWQGTSLIVTFDNEVRLNPNFSGDVLGRLYVGPDDRFRLAIWPLGVADPHEHLHEEVLLEYVADVQYSFYAAPEKIDDAHEIHTGKFIDPDKVPEKDHWHENKWAVTYEQMPSILKIVVKVAKNPEDLKSHHAGMNLETISHEFYFVLPSSKNPVQYPQESAL